MLSGASCRGGASRSAATSASPSRGRALETLERQGHTLSDDDIRHIHPVHFEHINPFGHYRFDTERGPAKGRLRPLRGVS